MSCFWIPLCCRPCSWEPLSDIPNTAGKIHFFLFPFLIQTLVTSFAGHQNCLSSFWSHTRPPQLVSELPFHPLLLFETGSHYVQAQLSLNPPSSCPSLFRLRPAPPHPPAQPSSLRFPLSTVVFPALFLQPHFLSSWAGGPFCSSTVRRSRLTLVLPLVSSSKDFSTHSDVTSFLQGPVSCLTFPLHISAIFFC